MYSGRKLFTNLQRFEHCSHRLEHFTLIKNWKEFPTTKKEIQAFCVKEVRKYRVEAFAVN